MAGIERRRNVQEGKTAVKNRRQGRASPPGLHIFRSVLCGGSDAAIGKGIAQGGRHVVGREVSDKEQSPTEAFEQLGVQYMFQVSR